MALIFIKHIWWFLTSRCENCGGQLEVYSAKNVHCIKCGKKN